MDHELITISDAARALGITSSKLRRLCNSGKIPFMRTDGGHRRIRMSDIQRLLSSRRSIDPDEDADAVKLLFADDNSTFTKACALLMTKTSGQYLCRFVSSGLEAIVQAERFLPNILLIDLDMGPDGFDGQKVIRALLDSDFYPNLKIVAVTGLSDAVITSRGGLPSSVLLFKKPVNLQRLKGAIEAASHFLKN